MVKTTARQITCRTRFEDAGYPRSGAAALVGNFAVESGQDLPTAFRKSHLDHGSNGLAQWRLARLTSYENFVKALHPELTTEDQFWPWYGRMDHQVDFVIHELETDYPALNAKLRKGGDPAALAADVCWQYERPNKALSGISNRVAYAKLLAVAASPGALANGPAVGVVDHLQAAANTERVKAQGGIVLASFSTAGAAAVVGSNYVDNLPTWEWVGIGVAVLAFVVGVIGHIASTNRARNIEQAVPGVTANAPPSEAVEHTEIAAPPPPSSDGPAGISPVVIPPAPLDIAEAVKAEVARQMSLIPPASAPVTAAPSSTEFTKMVDAEVERRIMLKATQPSTTVTNT